MSSLAMMLVRILSLAAFPEIAGSLKGTTSSREGQVTPGKKVLKIYIKNFFFHMTIKIILIPYPISQSKIIEQNSSTCHPTPSTQNSFSLNSVLSLPFLSFPFAHYNIKFTIVWSRDWRSRWTQGIPYGSHEREQPKGDDESKDLKWSYIAADRCCRAGTTEFMTPDNIHVAVSKFLLSIGAWEKGHHIGNSLKCEQGWG